MELIYKDLTSKILGAAVEVHKSLGPGFLESIYEAAFTVELSFLGIPYERQKHSKFNIVGKSLVFIGLTSLFND